MAINITTVSAPPKRTNTRPAAAAKKAAASDQTRNEHREAGLKQGASFLSFGLIAAGLKADAGAINRFGPGMITAIVEVAETDDKLGEKLDMFADAGPWAKVFASGLPLLFQFAANHKVVKAEALAGVGIVKPETLEIETETMLMKQHAAALREHRLHLEHVMQERKLAEDLEAQYAAHAADEVDYQEADYAED